MYLRFLLSGCLALLAAAAFGAGDVERGRAVAFDRERGDCAICHQMEEGEPRQQGNVGPPLLAIGARYPRWQLLDMVRDLRLYNPDTVMPPYGTTEGLYRVAEAYRGKPILTEQELEDLVAFLGTLRGSGE